MNARCPHCGGNTAAGAAVTRGKWWMGPVITYYDGDQLDLPRNLSRTLYAIARADGEPITHRDLPNMTHQTLVNHVSALRRQLGVRMPVRGIPHRGFVWDDRT
ncbi:hypothetical protein EDF56_106351 [Novosphingobium sp. PhB165]|uniref:hypothetical protein n=1 Tax=Novosphingobium sp. PhB165 TaxID=2485105 RepID=UPI001048EF05|nr:hypothetical protein [Novosphingobium sp. PhB165]TCM17235.1 hypothetical protein EDF56_106351 [Novosphingobium sp. PhB165]